MVCARRLDFIAFLAKIELIKLLNPFLLSLIPNFLPFSQVQHRMRVRDNNTLSIYMESFYQLKSDFI